jgi:hypothetical protein
VSNHVPDTNFPLKNLDGPSQGVRESNPLDSNDWFPSHTTSSNPRLRLAPSSVKCNTSNEILLELREDFVGRLEAEDFARAVVQGMLNGSEFLMRDVAQVHTFG